MGAKGMSDPNKAKKRAFPMLRATGTAGHGAMSVADGLSEMYRMMIAFRFSLVCRLMIIWTC